MEKYKVLPQDTLGLNTYKGVNNEEFIRFHGDYNAPFYAMQMGVTYPDENYFISRKSSSAYVLEYIVSGEGFVETEKGRETVSKGDVYLLPPGQRHSYGTSKENPYKKIWLNFSSKMFDQIISTLALDKIVYRGYKNAENAFNQILETAQKTYLDFSSVHAELSKIVFTILTDLSSLKNEPVPGTDFTRRVYTVLSGDAYNNIRIKDLAEKLCVSEAHLIKQFKQTYGVTPYKFLLNRKIDIAKNLLKNSDLSISQIAVLLDFNDEHYFSHLFSQKTGLTPTAFRKMSKK